MLRYGTVTGGIDKIRDIDPLNPFEIVIQTVFGDKIRNDELFAASMWSALANISWYHGSGENISYSYRAAGDLIVAIRQDGHYMDWYCCGPSGVVSDEIAEVLKIQGWSPIKHNL